MRFNHTILFLMFWLVAVAFAPAALRYVDLNSANAAPPYTSWATAASGIQEAIEVAVAGDEVVVTNGTYSVGGRSTIDLGTTTNRVVVDKPLALRSVNGPQSTIIDGGGVFRCVYLTNGASLSGFTLTNGASTRGAAGGGAYGGTLNNCVLSHNTARGRSALGQIFGSGGAAAYTTLNNCTLTGNWVPASDIRSTGGGAYYCTLTDCTLTGNSADDGGGANSSTLNNCTLTGNGASAGASSRGGGASGCTLNNCTLAGNSAVGSELGGGYGGGAFRSTLNNCIVYFNTALQDTNYDSSCVLNYSCTTPLPTNGVGNITNEPAFVNLAAGNYRLRSDSPCIDAGTNLSASITNDLDSRPRPLDGNGDGLAAFDMGAYEYRTPLLVWQDSPNPTPPHADWRTAAHTIQDAIDAALAGDEIVVTNGIYATGSREVSGATNRVAVDKALSVRSVNGPQSTIINGGGGVRCVYLANGASLSGFILTNGVARQGGGLWCESTNVVVSNCVVAGNLASGWEFSSAVGGGAYGGMLNNCILSENRVWGFDGRFGQPGVGSGGGAVNASLNNCSLTGNSASGEHYGFGGGASGCTLNNCTLTGNSVSSPYITYGGGGGASACTLNNCTLTDNSANSSDGGGGAAGCTLNNCIVYFNTAPQGANYSYSTLNYSCTTPQPTNGFGNITNAPLFMDQAAGNLHLQSNSPCINSGFNTYAPSASDHDGNLRIAGGSVDIGAYEFQSPASMLSYAWAQQYDLPIDGSADYSDSDSDLMNNWQEWIAGTVPIDASSALRLLAPNPNLLGTIVSWQSVSNRTYFLERANSLGAQPPFSLLWNNITGQAGTTSFTDTNVIGPGPFFYRVGVQQ